MNVLAIETSGSVCSAAVSCDGALLSSVEILRPNVHDTLLAECVRQAISHAGVTPADITCVAISEGPGSFTGLRIGAAYAKGFCVGGNASILPVNTLTSLHAAGQEVALLAKYTSTTAIIATNRDLYHVSQRALALPLNSGHVKLLASEDVVEYLSSETLVVGPAASTFQDFPISGLSRLSARFVALAAWHLIQLNVPFVDPDTFEPDYGQPFAPVIP